MARRRGRRRNALIFATFIAAPVALTPFAASAATPARGTPAVADRPTLAALRIARDPETGGWTLAPLPSGAVKLPATLAEQMALNQSDVGLLSEPLPGGGWTMDLQGRFQSYEVARRDAAGGLRYDCSQDPLSLFRWLVETPEPVDVLGRPVR